MVSPKHSKMGEYEMPKRLCIIGDIHGDMVALKEALRLSKMTNDDKWIAKDCMLIVLGDILDRNRAYPVVGEDGWQTEPMSKTRQESDIAVLKYLLNLKQSARLNGGNVQLLFGNHEMMNLSGDFRYVSARGFRHFRDPVKNVEYMVKEGETRDVSSEHESSGRAKWFSSSKTRLMFAKNFKLVVRVGTYLFSHAGIMTGMLRNKECAIVANAKPEDRITTMNKSVKRVLSGNATEEDKSFWMFLNYSTSPSGTNMLWNRVVSNPNSGYDVSKVGAMLGTTITRTFIGHSPVYMQGGKGGIEFNGNVVLCDVGMSRGFDVHETSLNENLHNNLEPLYLKIMEKFRSKAISEDIAVYLLKKPVTDLTDEIRETLFMEKSRRVQVVIYSKGKLTVRTGRKVTDITNEKHVITSKSLNTAGALRGLRKLEYSLLNGVLPRTLRGEYMQDDVSIKDNVQVKNTIRKRYVELYTGEKGSASLQSPFRKYKKSAKQSETLLSKNGTVVSVSPLKCKRM